MKLIYVCSPYSGDIKANAEKAKIYSRLVVDTNNIPITPHLLFPQFMSEEEERDHALAMNLSLLDRCDELWVFGEKMTRGMKFEMAHAHKIHLPIKKVFLEEIKMEGD